MSTCIIIILFCLVLSAYFSATETAFSTMNRTRMKTLAEAGNRRAELALKLSASYEKLLTTILVGNNIVNIAAASLGTVLFVGLYGDAGATISTAVMTVAVLIFGEISPKSIARDCPERFAMFSAPSLRVLMWVLTPVNFVFSAWKKLLSKVLRLQSNTKMSQAELLMLVDEVQQDGSIDKNEGELLRSAIEFTEREAEDILTHRVDLAAVPDDAEKSEVAREFEETRFSRLLVYHESIDNITGAVHQKDFYVGSGITDRPLADIVTPVVYVLKNEKISALMRIMQRSKTHVAVVLDEYGGTYGIVTMEDILEELVGEIWDEHDEVTESFKKLGEGEYLVDGSVDLDKFCAYFGVKTDSEMVSLSGFVMERLGAIPVVGAAFDFEGLHITVKAVEYHRVMLVDVKRDQPAAEEK